MNQHSGQETNINRQLATPLQSDPAQTQGLIGGLVEMVCGREGVSLLSRALALSSLIFLAGLLNIYPIPSHAAPMNFYGIAGIGHINKPIISMREQKFTDLVEQKYDFSCGAAALTTILRYAYNQDISELDVLKGLATVSDEEVVREKGFSLLDLRKYIDSLGMRGRGYEVGVELLPRMNIPAIVLLNIRGYRHFVVFKRIIDDKVYIGDPALGNRILSKQEFVDAWNGSIFVVIGKGFDRNTVLRQPTQPLTARQFLQDLAPMTNAELLDFGFSYADLF